MHRMLRERERLARELHDSLGQMLGFVNTQAQAAHQAMANGQVEQARTLQPDIILMDVQMPEIVRLLADLPDTLLLHCDEGLEDRCQAGFVRILRCTALPTQIAVKIPHLRSE